MQPACIARQVAVLLLCSTASAEVLISEFLASNRNGLEDEEGGTSDWIEFYNNGANPVNLDGYYVTDNPGNLIKWRFPSVTLGAGEFVVVFASDPVRQEVGQPLHTGFNLGAAGEYLGLVGPDGETILQEFAPAFPEQFADVSYGFASTSVETVLLGDGSPARALVPSDDALGESWGARDFNDSSWVAGALPAGYEDGAGYENLIALDVAATPDGGAYLRIPFEVTDPEDIDRLVLSVRYDDGFRAFLNGRLVAARNAPDGSLPGDGLVSFTHTVSGGGAGDLTGVTVVRGGVSRTYSTAQLIPVTLTAFNAGSTSNLAVPAGSGVPPAGMRAALLEMDATLNSGVINPGLGGAPLATDPVPGTTPGFAIDFAEPIVNAPGPDIVFFELQTTSNPATGDPINVGPLTGVTGGTRRAIRVDDYDIPFVSGAPLAPFDLFAGSIGSLDALQNSAFSAGSSGLNGFRAIATGIDLSDLGFSPGESAVGLFIQGVGASIVDPVFIAGLPEEPGAGWNATASASRADADALVAESIDISQATGEIVSGDNVLAIHGLNASGSDDDFLIAPELVATRLEQGNSALRYFSTPTPGAPNDAGASDLGPLAHDISHAPAVPGDGDDLVVTAVVDTLGEPVEEVSLTYRAMFGAETTVAMAPGAAGSYSAVIPAAAADPGEMLRYFITTEDAAGNTGRFPRFGDPFGSPEYFGTVVADPSVTTPMRVMHRFVADVPATNTDAGTRASVYFDGQFYDNVFMRIRGRGSRSWPKKSYKIDFNDGHHFRFRPDFPRVDEININSTWSDPSYIRTVLAFETWRDAGSPSSDVQLIRVQQNGAFFNLAVMIEQVDRDYLRRHGLDADGALYKMDTNSLDSSTRGLEKKTRRDEGNSDLQALIDGLNLEGREREIFLFDNVNLPSEITYLAANVLSQHVSGTVRNYYVYRDSEGSGEWQELPWDPDISHGHVFASQSGLLATDDSPSNPWSHPLMGSFSHPLTYGSVGTIAQPLRGAIYAEPRTREMFLRRLRTLMDAFLAGDHYGSRVAALRDLIGGDTPLDAAEWGANTYTGAEVPLQQSLDNLIDNYFAPRRTHLFQTHLASNASYADRAGIPDMQPADAGVSIGRFEFSPPSGNQDDEWIEIRNPNAFAADISGWALAGAVGMTFREGTVIPAGERCYVTPDVVAYRRIFGGQGHFVQGDYNGHLAREGETLELRRRDGVVVESITYIDSRPAWDATYFDQVELGDPNVSADGADPDGDRRSNFDEFVFGGRPDRADPGGDVYLALVPEGSVAFTFSRRIDAPYLDFIVEGSQDLLTWVVVDVEVPVTHGSGMAPVTVEMPAGVATHAYYRVRATR